VVRRIFLKLEDEADRLSRNVGTTTHCVTDHKSAVPRYMVKSRDQHAAQNHNINTGNSSFERVEDFKCLWTALTTQSSIHEEIMSRLNSGNACYHSVQNILSSGLLPKNMKMKIYSTVILSVVLYGCETWSVTLTEERRLRVFENRVLRRNLGPMRTR
jgi:hypothetical protein